MLSATCIINNYNYCDYLGEAIESVLNQSRPFEQIIIVDDCSSDGSKDVIRTYVDSERVTAVLKSVNGGQLSCFNEVCDIISGDIVFFLDSDDAYKNNYLEEVMAAYENNKLCDFVFVDLDLVGDAGKDQSLVNYKQDRFFGLTVLLTLYRENWIGSATSGISMRKSIVNKILPIPFAEDWRTRADDCLVWGASIVGARKYFISKKLVEYRIHGANNWFGGQYSFEKKYLRCLATDRLFTHFKKKFDFSDNIIKYAYLEYRQTPFWDYDTLIDYYSIVANSNLNFTSKVKNYSTLLVDAWKKMRRYKL